MNNESKILEAIYKLKDSYEKRIMFSYEKRKSEL